MDMAAPILQWYNERSENISDVECEAARMRIESERTYLLYKILWKWNKPQGHPGIMGHADIQTTMDIYAKATEEKKQEVFSNLQGKIV